MADVKIGVSGNPDAAKSAIQVMTEAVNKLGKAVADANKVQFTAVGVEKAEKDLARLNRQFQEAVKQSKALRDALKNTGQTADAGILNVDFSRLSLNPQTAQRIRDRAFAYASRGTAWDQTNVPAQPPAPPVPPGPSPRRRPQLGGTPAGVGGVISRTGGAFVSGFGGPVAQIGQEAISGARAGAQAGAAEGGVGGLLGGVGGLLKGAGIATLAVGAFKGAQMISEGVGMAQERDLTLDTLKRQMGDLGVSFDELKQASDSASGGLGVNAREFAQLAEQFTQASHGVDQLPQALAQQVRDSTGFARAFGMQPGQAMGFFGGMRALDPRQNNRELAALMAEAIDRTGGRALASDVMQAVESFAASASRLSLTAPNVAGFAGAYASMVNQGTPGMTPENAASIIGRANAAVTGMGAAGEAGQNFLLQAFNQGGVVNPLSARALAAGGLFGSRANVFGLGTQQSPYTEYGQFLADRGVDMRKLLGAHPEVTNFEAIRRKAEREFAGRPEEMAGAIQRLTGLASPQQAMALMNVRPQQMGGLGQLLQTAGVDINTVNESGIRTLAKISNAPSRGALTDIYGEISKRTGAGALTPQERQKLEEARGGSTENFRVALAQVMASKEQQETEASDMRKGRAALENIQIDIGEKLVPATNTMRDALLSIARAIAPDAGGGTGEQEPSGAGTGLSDKQIADLKARREELKTQMERARLSGFQERITDASGHDLNAAETRAARQKAIDEINRALTPPAAPRNGAASASAGAGSDSGFTISPIGVLNNNPFDMRPWRAGQDQAGGFLRYDDMQSGVTAGFQNLLVAQDKHHRDTLSQIITAYSPPSENDTQKLIANASRMTGFGPQQKLNLHDPAVLRAVGNAMLANEGTADSVTQDQISRGVSAALGGGTALADNRRASPAAARPADGARDTVILDINMNVIATDRQGGSTTQQTKTSVAVPRGSGVRTIALSN